MTRHPPRTIGGLVAGLVVLLFGAMPAARAGTVTVPTSVEAWYASLPSAGARPADTLHAGVTAGIEDSRSYLALDLDAVGDAEVLGGLLRLPIDAASSQAPEGAAMSLCLAGSPGPEVEGSTGPPPPVDCSVTSKLTLAAGAFTADLAPFAASLRTAGLAIVPVAAPGASWHVTFWGRANRSPGASPITAAVERRDPPATTPTTAANGSSATPTATTDDHLDGVREPSRPAFASPETAFASPAPFALPPAVDAASPALGTSAGDGTAIAAPVVRRSLPTGVVPPNSLAFALPLVLLVLAGYLCAALTRPAIPHARAPGGRTGGPPPGAGARSPNTDG
jgi:hypothetical protein